MRLWSGLQADRDVTFLNPGKDYYHYHYHYHCQVPCGRLKCEPLSLLQLCVCSCTCACRSGITAWRSRIVAFGLFENEIMSSACKRPITHGVYYLIKLTENANCFVILCNELCTTGNLFCGSSWLFTFSIRNAEKTLTKRAVVHSIMSDCRHFQRWVLYRRGWGQCQMRCSKLLAGRQVHRFIWDLQLS